MTLLGSGEIIDYLFGKTSKTLDEIFDEKDLIPEKTYTSISDRASEGILQFPMIASESLDISAIQMVAKACERNYASFVEIVLTMNPEITSGRMDIGKYLKQFHQNTKNIRGSEYFNESASIPVGVCGYEINGIMGNSRMYEKHLGELRPFMDDFVTESLNSKYNPSFRKNVKMIIPVKEARRGGGNNTPPSDNRTFNNTNYNNIDDHRRYTSTLANSNNRVNNTVANSNNRVNNTNVANSNNRVTNNITNRNTISSVDIVPKDILRDNDVKKANELIPTTLHIKLLRRGSEDAPASYVDFILGVKTYIHPVKTEEMITNLVDAANSKDTLFNFIRWTTGEIKFFKDFLFKINDIKRDVGLGTSKDNSGWRLALKRRASSSNIFTKGSLLPNATFVISADEVEYIKANFGHDLLNRSTVKKIMREYFLLGFVVVDVSSEIVHFMFENENDFHDITFNGLERENTNVERQYRELLKAAQKTY